MVRYRRIKKYSDTWVIRLTVADAQDYNLKEDGSEFVDVEELLKKRVVKKEGVK